MAITGPVARRCRAPRRVITTVSRCSPSVTPRPVPIRGRTWYPVGGPRVTRFRTGGAVESWLVAPALTVGTLVLAVLVIPGVLPVFLAVRDQVQRLLGA